MAFIGNEKRKAIHIQKDIELDVLKIPIEQMVLKDDSHTAYFRRLGFKGCPNAKSKGFTLNFELDRTLQDMNRWKEVKNLYSIMIKLDRRPRTKINIFNAIVSLIQHCDEKGIKDFYSAIAIRSYIFKLKGRYLQGIKGKTVMQIQNSIKVVLSEVNPTLLCELSADFLTLSNDTSPSSTYSDEELKKVVKALYKIFNSYKECAISNTVPQVHPLYNEETLLTNNNFNGHTEKAWKKKLYTKNFLDKWRNELINTAFYLTSFYTGANESALLNLKLSDISADTFNQVSSGSYILKTVKYRQGGKENFIEIGFSKKAKEFFETWLLLRKIIIKQEFDYVFPHIIKNKITKTSPASSCVSLNNTFGLLGLPLLSTQRFRKTKATLIMRATESIFSVAEGLNNSPETVSRHYSNGMPELMEFSIAGALDVRQRTVQGESLDEAVIESAYHFRDPVREQFYLEKKLEVPNNLSNGLRCKDSFGEKAKQLKKSLVKAGLAKQKNKVACHKFLECFGCPYHAVIAEVDDIWLMLSFRDVILEVACQPSINSIPTTTLTKVTNTVESILERLKREFPHVYKSAEVKYSELPHPLWADKTDFNVLMELH
ncbi:site-specific integrase [Pseudoalteromonas sp. C2R02]|uniref:site-specific integrase n=1 Tax=Pseudoalteromonas sp. C2R02 TaxID=2841565 RepID=UPI001C08E8D2|nr:site-specific integrase [Pseudoalteromonas sp. C2R02]MBU2970019.1 site-specific integrase [Pseudoalteromonas sp. C2R02]